MQQLLRRTALATLAALTFGATGAAVAQDIKPRIIRFG